MKRLDCYIWTANFANDLNFDFQSSEITLSLVENRPGIICFAIPELGILFRRVQNENRIALEYTALFSLLRFLETSLKEVEVKEVRIHSSLPELVLGLARVADGGVPEPYLPLLKEYLAKYIIEAAYIPRNRNRAATTITDFPSIPKDSAPAISPDDFFKSRRPSTRT